MAAIQKRRFGRTNLMITELGFGAMNLRMLESKQKGLDLLHHVLDQGINFIDTARSITGTCADGTYVESEELVGEAIEQRTDLTEPIVIVTKGHGYELKPLAEDLAATRKALRIQGLGEDMHIGQTPVRLVYFLHGIGDERWAVVRNSGVLPRLRELQQEGLISFPGFSSHYPFAKEIREAVDTDCFDVVELPYNVYNRSLGEDGETDILKYIHEKDLGIVNMKAFNGNSMLPIYQVLREFVSIDYRDMLNFCLSNPYITSVDAGARSPEEIDADIEVALGKRPSAEERKGWAAEADKVSGLMKDTCRECMHCLEKFSCPNGLNFPEILSVYSRMKICTSLGKDIRQYQEQYRALPMSGADCLECGACLEWCEYKLNIPKLLKEAEETLR